MTCTTVHSLTVDDFYNDINAAIVETVTDTVSSSNRDLPVHISNLISFDVVARYRVSIICC